MAPNDRSVLATAARGERVDGTIDAATVRLAATERMTGLLAHLAADPPRELQMVAAAIHARALSLSAELARIVAAFRDANIPLLALKGPVASQQLYGHPGLRLFADLDLIVDEASAVRGEALLEALSYRDEEKMTPAQRATKHRFHNGTPFVSDARATTVDFHWRFGHVQFPLALPFADAWRRRTAVDLTGTPIPTLGLTDLAIFTCSHAAKHFWTPLEMLAQIAALVRLAEMDWKEVDRVAVASRAARQVGLSFLIAQDVIGSAIPPLPRCLAASRPVFARLQERLAKPHDHDAGGRDLFLILDRKRDVIAAAAASIFFPTHSDWAAAEMPHVLYWVARPLRLLRARLGKR
jgi:hypothetical protein